MCRIPQNDACGGSSWHLRESGVNCGFWVCFFLAHRMPAVCLSLGSITRSAGSMAQAGTSLCMLHDHVWLALSFIEARLCDLSRCMLRPY